MNWKKALLIGCPLLFLVVVGLCSGGGYLVWRSLTEPADAANRFFALLGQGKVHEAYLSTATAMQSQQDEEAFTEAVRLLSLTDYESSSWPERRVYNNEATLRGTIRRRDGGVVPMVVKLVHEGRQWRVLSFVGREAGGAVLPAEQVPK